MIAPLRRSRVGAVTVEPSIVRPRQWIQVTVQVPRRIDKVTSARIELGYRNFYRYRWAGRTDAAAAEVNDALWLQGDVGTNYGTDRDTHDWVSVQTTDLPAIDGEFDGGSTRFRIPSWAAGSSTALAQWCVRLVVERRGRDIRAEEMFTVVISAADVTPCESTSEHVAGDEVAAMDIALPATVYRAGDTISGHLTITPSRDLPDGDAGVFWQRCRYSHPLTRTPGAGTELDGPVVHLGKRTPLRAGVTVHLPFSVPLPVDAAPTAEAVHSSLDWFVHARMFYAGWTARATERVRRAVVVVNAP